VCTTWAVIGERYYLLDVVRERLEIPALKQRMIEEANRWKAKLVLLEDKGSGMSLLQELTSTGFFKGRAIKPEGDKVIRLVAVTAMLGVFAAVHLGFGARPAQSHRCFAL
jgi:predicted phage terminase large subunit-like protein